MSSNTSDASLLTAALLSRQAPSAGHRRLSHRSTRHDSPAAMPAMHSAQEPLPQSALSYLRYVLSTDTVATARNHPPPGVNETEWRAIWSSKFQPIIRAVECYDACLLPIVVLVGMVWFVGIPIYLATYMATTTADDVMGLAGALSTAIVLFACLVYARARRLQWRALQTVCYKDQDENGSSIESMLQPHGFNVECQYESWNGTVGSSGTSTSSHGFCLYLIPCHHNVTADVGQIQTKSSERSELARNGYLRIEIFTTGRFGCTWTPISLSRLEYFTILPDEYRELDEVWNGFWSHMRTDAPEIMRAWRQSLLLFMAWILLTVTLVYFLGSDGIELSTMLSLATGSPARWKYLRAMHQQRDYIDQHVATFALRGFHVEHRRVHDYSQCCGCGWHVRHYLYLFPMEV